MEPQLQVRPSRDEFDALAAQWPLVPIWTELLADVSTPVGLFPAIAGDGPGLILESVERSERWGRYSFVAGDPAAVVVVDADGVRIENVVRPLPVRLAPAEAEPREALIAIARSLAGPRPADLPPFTGGLMGYLAYEAATLLDGHPAPEPGDAPCPPIGLLVIDRAVVFDHWRQRLILVAHVPAGAYDEGVQAIHDLAARIASAAMPALAPSVDPTSSLEVGEANMPDEGYRWTVSAFKEHILAGDIYQGVPSRRVTFDARDGGFPIYRRLRVTNPAPYMFFVRMLGMELAGSSPEPLVRVEGRRVSARPIAGTRPRGQTEIRDRLLEHELLADPKEQAEHAMLVDLARNDLGRVCVAGSVRPTELMEVERFTKVMHIVSTVEGELREELHPLDALAVTFPAGTVTGAPKRRAMELIAEHEPTARGPYAGAVGYLTFAGDLDFCITIRTAVIVDGRVSVQTGAGVVADSDPESELQETKAKAAALLPAVAPGDGRLDGDKEPGMILIVDHYDSFTYNLVQLVESLGRPTEVVKSDQEPAEALVGRNPDAVILSPGPGRPEDAGVFTSLLSLLPDGTPVLGVCLGHQALGISCGGVVDRETPVHGKASLVFHEGKGIFEGVSDPFEAGRYHSLVVLRKRLPEELELTAWTEDGLVMAAQHRSLPRYGVQFHPESILTPEGPRIVENFLALSR